MTTNEANPIGQTEITPPVLAEGRKLAGCYVLKQPVTTGGAADLWQAHDEVLGKDVLLQFIPDEVRQDAGAMADIRRETKRNRQLIHPDILRVYDFVEEPEWAAVSMDAFEGESLESVLAKKQTRILSPGEIEPWIFQLCQTLDDAHTIGLFHRNISPENICFKPGGGVFLTGFGISRCVSDALRRTDGAQESGFVRLSPQLADGQPPARSDDIYGCGALLYELLTGAPLFSGGDLADQIRNSIPKLVGEVRPKDLDPVPPNWEKAIAACLAKNPAERPPTEGRLAKLLTIAPAGHSPESMPAGSSVAPAASALMADEKKGSAGKEGREGAARQENASQGTAPGVRKRSISIPAEPLAPKSSCSEATPDKAWAADSNAPSKQAKSAQQTTAKPARPTKPDPHPSVYGNRSHFPVLGFVVALGLIFIGAIGYYFIGSHNPDSTGPAPGSTPAVQANDAAIPTAEEDLAAKAVANSGKTPAPSPNEGASVVKPDANAKSNPPEMGEKPAGTKVGTGIATPKASSSPNPVSASSAEAALAGKQAALEAAKQAAQAAEKSFADLTAERRKADADVSAAQKAIDEKVKNLAPAKKAVEDLLTKRKKLEDDQKTAEAAAQQAQQLADDKLRAAVAAKQVVEDLTAKNQDKLAALDKADAEVAELKKALEVKQEAASADAKALADADAARQKQLDLVKSFGTPGSPAPAQSTPPSVAASAPPPKPELSDLAKLTKPDGGPAVELRPPSTEAGPTLAGGNVNTLGQKFVPVGDVEFCIWQTRVKDFEVFARDVNLKSSGWRNPGFKQAPDHPVVNVTWLEAMAFCKWLTDKEHKEGVLPTNQFYRLPTDMEWSKGVGLPEEPGRTPADRNMAISDVYPWGREWPPPPGAGNYSGEETQSEVAIKGYNDGFPWTSPVGSFPPNKLGLCDMGGNVWQWCLDSWDGVTKGKVLRGASWHNGALKPSLLSSCRIHAAPDSSLDNFGFRVVKAVKGSRAARK